MSEVTVETPAETPDEDTVVVNEGDTTVVVETPETPGDELPADAMLLLGQIAERVTNIENRLGSAELTADIALDTADMALDEAFVAEETAEDVGDATVEVADAVVNDDTSELEETAEEVEDNSDTILPTKKHFVHRSFRDLLGRG